MDPSIEQQLINYSDASYRTFMQKLVLEGTNILGVRMPKLRTISSFIAIDPNWHSLLGDIQHDIYFEHTMIRALVIAQLPIPESTRIEYIRSFLPNITNWALCDSFCSSLKKCVQRDPDAYLALIDTYFCNTLPYHVRFSLVMLLMHFVHMLDVDEYFRRIQDRNNEHHTVYMATGWAVATAFITHTEATKEFLLSHTLSYPVAQIAMQKIIDSKKVSTDDKTWIRQLRNNYPKERSNDEIKESKELYNHSSST